MVKIMERCPHCGSEDIYFSKKRKLFVCEDCDETFLDGQNPDTIISATDGKLELFFSYGHDRNRFLVERIKNDFEKRGHHVWIDSTQIKPGDNWRDNILDGVMNAASVIAFLSEHSTRNPGVCLDELKIAVCARGADIKTVLLEPEDRIKPPATLSDIQWLDMSDWYEIKNSNADFESWYSEKFAELCRVIESKENAELSGDIHLLKQRLSPYLNTEKEYSLLSKEFYGRKWLADYIEEWRNRPSEKPLVIYGKPGSGKSAFCVNFAHYNSDVFGCFLCEWNREGSINPSQLIKTIAYRLAAKLPDYRNFLLQQLHQDGNSLDDLSNDALFDYLLSYPLNHLIDGKREAGLVIIDGLDEAEKNGANPLADVFARCVERLPSWIRFVFTSRPERNVSVHFQVSDTVNIVKDMPAGYNDIMAYLVKALSSKLMSVSNRLEVLNQICDLSEGTFLYAELLAEDIKSDIIDIGELNRFPKGLSSFYRVSMARKFTTKDEFEQIRNCIEVLTVAETIPEELLIGTCGYSQYSYFKLLDVMSSWLNRQDEEGLTTVGFSHKSLMDWFSDANQSGSYYASPQNGAAALAHFCQAQIESGDTARKFGDRIEKYIENHIAGFFVASGEFLELEAFLLEHAEVLSPYWLSWYEFPSTWNHDKLTVAFWTSTSRNKFVDQLQHEGNTKLLTWILNNVVDVYGIETLDRHLISVYMDIVHMSGKYLAAVDIADRYLSGVSPAEIVSDEFLLNLNVRKLHHSMFVKPVRPLIDSALALFTQIDSQYPTVTNELLFLIGGNLGVLSGDWKLVDAWLGKSEKYAQDHQLTDFFKRNARKRADFYCHMGQYELGVAEIKHLLPSVKAPISDRYENYLVGAMGNLYTCMGREDEALQCYEDVLRFSSAKGIIGWTAHANLGIANVNYKLGNIREAMDFANRANSTYKEISQSWGLIMSHALISICESTMGTAPLKVACEEDIKHATRMQYDSCITAIEDLCAGKENFLKLYFL